MEKMLLLTYCNSNVQCNQIFNILPRTTMLHVICVAALLYVCMFGAIDGWLSVIDFCLCNSWQVCLDVSPELGVLVKDIRTCIWMHSKPNGHQYVGCILLLCSSWLRPGKHPQTKHMHQYNQQCA